MHCHTKLRSQVQLS